MLQLEFSNRSQDTMTICPHETTIMSAKFAAHHPEVIGSNQHTAAGLYCQTSIGLM